MTIDRQHRSYPNLSIDGERLWSSLMAMAAIGATPAGGCNRQALTDVDAAGRSVFRDWCEDAGLTVSVDDMGTMYARRDGIDPELPPVAVGSHLDTQPTGGKFDGVLGVLGALEVVRALNDAGILTRHPIEIVNWTNEEGTRFAPAMLASGVFAGVYERAWAIERRDPQGIAFGDELARIGFAGSRATRERRFHAYLELHIEQGPILEAEGDDIGIVTHGQGAHWLDFHVTGRGSHSGSTPMALRHDALLGAAAIVGHVHEVAERHPPGVGTVGAVSVEPNSRNVVPGRVKLGVDLRHPDRDILSTMASALVACAREAAVRHRLGLEHETVGRFEPVAFDEACLATVRRAAIGRGLTWRDIVSGAGHDACYVARVAPTAMIFCPCKDGLSHNEAEDIHPDWARNGTNVLLDAVLALAGVGE